MVGAQCRKNRIFDPEEAVYAPSRHRFPRGPVSRYPDNPCRSVELGRTELV